jgi:hypothetical protein
MVERIPSTHTPILIDMQNQALAFSVDIQNN